MALVVGTKGKQQNVNVGPKWFKGDPGGHYTPTVSEDGNLTWLPSEEDMPAVPGANIAGPIGPAGEPGKSGVWTGEDTPPEGYDVWVAPGGEASATVPQEQMERYVSSEIEKIELMPGPQGEPGPAGADGAPGQDGKTPEKGVDYWTEEDKAELVNEVLAALPAAEEVEV